MKTKAVLAITLLINFAQIARYIDLEQQGLNWWSAIYLRDIVIYFIIFIQMGIEYSVWNKKLLKWRSDLVFEQRLNDPNDDMSESKVRRNIQSIVEQIADNGNDNIDFKIVEEKLPVDKELSLTVKAQKSYAIDATIYSATYVSLIKSNKHKYVMTQAD